MQSAIQTTIRLGMLALLSTVYSAILVAQFCCALAERKPATTNLLPGKRRAF
jgi:hypothetical protein